MSRSNLVVTSECLVRSSRIVRVRSVGLLYFVSAPKRILMYLSVLGSMSVLVPVVKVAGTKSLERLMVLLVSAWWAITFAASRIAFVVESFGKDSNSRLASGFGILAMSSSVMS